jgi:hypothetical protein
MAEEVSDEANQEESFKQYSSLVDEQLKYMESRLNYLGFVEKIVGYEKKQVELYKNQKYVSNISRSSRKNSSSNRN